MQHRCKLAYAVRCCTVCVHSGQAHTIMILARQLVHTDKWEMGQSMLGGPSPSLKTLTIASKNSRTRPHLKPRSEQSAYRSVCIHKQYLHIRRDEVYEKFAAAGSRGPWRRLCSWAPLTMADTDEELVRKLHLEINGLSRPRRARVVHEVPGTHPVPASGCTTRSPRRLRPAQTLYVCIFTVLSMQASSSHLASSNKRRSVPTEWWPARCNSCPRPARTSCPARHLPSKGCLVVPAMRDRSILYFCLGPAQTRPH